MPSLATGNPIFRKVGLGSPRFYLFKVYVTKCGSTPKPLSGAFCGRVKNGALELGAAGSFPQPSAADIFSRSTGPFATGNKTERNVVIPLLAAVFNRMTLLLCDEHPNGTHKGQYYNETNVDGRGMRSLMVMLHRIEDIISAVR